MIDPSQMFFPRPSLKYAVDLQHNLWKKYSLGEKKYHSAVPVPREKKQPVEGPEFLL